MRCRNLFVTGSIVMVLLSGWAVAGCVSAVPPIRLYTGPEKSRSEVATIAGAIESIDGRPIADPLIFKGSEIAYVVQYQPFELLPGRHTVVIRSRYPHAARWMPEYTIEFKAEPGKSYFAFPGSLWGGPSVKPTGHKRVDLLFGPFGSPTGRVVGTATEPPDSTDGQSPQWSVELVAAARTPAERAVNPKIPVPPGPTLLVIRKSALAEIFTSSPGGPRPVMDSYAANFASYVLAVAVRLQYVGPDGDVPAPGVWLIGAGGRILSSQYAIGITRYTRAAEDDDLKAWLFSGLLSGRSLEGSFYWKPRTRRLSSGETFFADVPTAVWRFHFQVPEGIAPDEFRLAFEDVPPLRLPPVTFAGE